MKTLLRLLLCTLALLAGSANAERAVQVPSLDQQRGAPVLLPGLWFAAPVSGRQPAMILLHGCSGAFDHEGDLAPRFKAMVATLNANGIGALVLDSLTPRGQKELCTQRLGTRHVTMKNRRRDALGGLQWLAARDDVDASRLGLVGWSNGGSTVLAATNRRHPEVAASPVLPSLAIAFYPGCAGDLIRGYQAVAPLLIMIGEADDWTPAQTCKTMVAQASGLPPQLVLYAGAYHGFDGDRPVRLRQDVPNGIHPGAGVHLGLDPAAKEASALRVQAFLNEHWHTTAAKATR